MSDQPTTYEPTPRAAVAIRIVWLIAAVAALTVHHSRRYLSASAPRWQGVVTGVLLAVAAWSVAGLALELAAWVTGMPVVRAATYDSQIPTDAVFPSGPLPLGDPRLQPGFVDPLDETPVPPMLQHAAHGGPDDGTAPTWLPEGLAPWWLDIVAAAHEHGLDSHAWGAIVAQECPWGDPACGSHAGARGLSQIMPATAAEIEGATGLPCRAQATDGPTSLRCGAWYFAERVRTQADLWIEEGDDEALLLIAAGLYNGGSCGIGIRQAVIRGDGDVCAAATCGETRTYCYAFRDRWRQTLAERSTGGGPTLPLPQLEAMTLP